MSTRLFAGLLAAALLLIPAACAEAEAAPAEPVNDTCPIMGDEVTAESESIQWNGHTVAFCCDGCPEKFTALPEAEQRAKLVAAGAELDG